MENFKKRLILLENNKSMLSIYRGRIGFMILLTSLCHTYIFHLSFFLLGFCLDLVKCQFIKLFKTKLNLICLINSREVVKEEERRQPHRFRTPHYCWCDKDMMAQYNQVSVSLILLHF